MFSSLFRSTPAPTTLGYKVATNAGISREFENIKGTIEKTNKKYREEISKYKEIAKLNEHISKGYLKNLDAMIDVSKILNYYVEIFNILKVELDKNDRVLGDTSLKLEDISYLERLTKNKVDELGAQFMNETEQLKKLYTAYGKTQELGRVNEAQNSFRTTAAATTDAVTKIKAIQEQGLTPTTGGRKRMPRKKPLPKTKSTSKPKNVKRSRA